MDFPAADFVKQIIKTDRGTMVKTLWCFKDTGVEAGKSISVPSKADPVMVTKQLRSLGMTQKDIAEATNGEYSIGYAPYN